MRVSDKQVRDLTGHDYELGIEYGIGNRINMADMACDLLDARSEIDALKAALDEAKATKEMYKERCERAEAEWHAVRAALGGSDAD